MKPILARILLAYFRFFARLQLKKYAPDIIGVTGSAGKTSCRNAIYAILKDKYRVKVSFKANSESGLSLNLLNLKPQSYHLLDWVRLAILAPIRLLTLWQPYEKYLAEMGIDADQAPKNMAYLLTIIQPRTAIFLNVLPVHTAFFRPKNGSILKAIAQEKGRLITNLPANGLAILNADDPLVAAFASQTRAQVMYFGTQPHCHLRFKSWTVSSHRTLFRFSAGTTTATIAFPHLLPRAYGYTFAAALCLALDEDFQLNQAASLLEKNYQLPPGRSTIFVGINGSIIIDSSYNASPQTMMDLLNLLQKTPAKRKYAILGDMRELGPEQATRHRQVLDQAQKICTQVYLTGPIFHPLASPPSLWFDQGIKAAKQLKAILQPGDVVLIKGSQNTIFLETAVATLLAQPDLDLPKLCRRGPFWDRQRQLLGI